MEKSLVNRLLASFQYSGWRSDESRAMSVRGEICYRISKALMRPPEAGGSQKDQYSEWRVEEMVRSWSHFSNRSIDGKDVLDFGCGEGPLSLHLARTAAPRSMVGVDLDERAIARALTALARSSQEDWSCTPEFLLSEPTRVPVADTSVDTILAFDCVEHIMDLETIMAEWRRVLRPKGRVLIEWCPFKGPWGPHMHNLIPIPWAHVLFGEQALFECAERIYDDPQYVPRHWDFDEHGARRPNSWRTLRCFSQAGYLNQVDVSGFQRVAREAKFSIERFEAMGIGADGMKRAVGKALLALPWTKEYATSFVVCELMAA